MREMTFASMKDEFMILFYSGSEVPVWVDDERRGWYNKKDAALRIG